MIGKNKAALFVALIFGGVAAYFGDNLFGGLGISVVIFLALTITAKMHEK